MKDTARETLVDALVDATDLDEVLLVETKFTAATRLQQ